MRDLTRRHNLVQVHERYTGEAGLEILHVDAGLDLCITRDLAHSGDPCLLLGPDLVGEREESNVVGGDMTDGALFLLPVDVHA